MSDGPHRSLSMRRHWKDFAERAAKAAFSPDQVCEALPLALKRDILEAPIEAMREILDNRKPDLFSTHHIEKLEELRRSCPGVRGRESRDRLRGRGSSKRIERRSYT
jgi:hypothetical protein